ncbi:MAG: acyl carrier protein [Clostridiaceae bacterium]|jgi:acyl carrier protein|nr:acyl carrier protein [Clostridiaceae bacterium]
MNIQAVNEKLKEFFENNFLYGESFDDINGDESLIDKGYVDSIGIISLVAFIENAIGIKVYDSEIVPENFDSINSIYAYLKKKMNTQDKAV